MLHQVKRARMKATREAAVVYGKILGDFALAEAYGKEYKPKCIEMRNVKIQVFLMQQGKRIATMLEEDDAELQKYRDLLATFDTD